MDRRRSTQAPQHAGTVDLAVHSLKDLPTLPVDGLVLAAVPARGPAGDVFVSRRHPRFDALPAGATKPAPPDRPPGHPTASPASTPRTGDSTRGPRFS